VTVGGCTHGVGTLRETAVELNEQALLEVEEVKIPALQKALDDAKAEAAKHEQAYTDFAYVAVCGCVCVRAHVCVVACLAIV